MKNFMKKTAKGFTLVELIIVIGLMSVLMIMVGLIMKPISQVFADTTGYTEDRYVMDGMAQYIDESLKYADRVWIMYDYNSLAIDGTWMETYMPTYMNVPKEKIHVLAIINDNSSAGYTADDFVNNNGVQTMGRIYKSAYVDGARKVWLVGGEAFYGDGAYFVNLEGIDGDLNGHYDSGDLKYTIYSMDQKQYEKNSYASNLTAVAGFRDLTREQIQSYTTDNALIANYAEKGVHFVNNPSFGDMTNGGFMTPIDGLLGATSAQGNAGGGNSLTVNPGYNIYIYYTVPE